MPELSIITINYNNADGLKKTIQSVINQSFADYEYIIIDGGSTDNSAELIKKYSDKITYWISEKDQGIYNAQNKGIARATGNYCLFLNSGDYLVDDKVLAKVHSYNLSADIIYGDMQTNGENGKNRHLKMPDKIGVKRLYADTVWHPVSFIKRELFSLYGNYDEQFKIVADYEFFVRVIIKRNVSTKHIPVEISVFDTTGLSSDMTKKDQLIQERRIVQNTYFNPILLFFFRLYSKIRS